MSKELKTASFPVVTVEEFKKIILDMIVKDASGWTTEHIISYYMESGFPKFDIQNLASVMKDLEGHVFYVSPVLVDFHSEFYWMVSGTDAILVKKPLTT